MKVQGNKYHETIYSEINDIVNEVSLPEEMANKIINDFRISDIEKILEILLDDRRKMKHKICCQQGLWATDRPDLIIDDNKVLFQLK